MHTVHRPPASCTASTDNAFGANSFVSFANDRPLAVEKRSTVNGRHFTQAKVIIAIVPCRWQ